MPRSIICDFELALHRANDNCTKCEASEGLCMTCHQSIQPSLLMFFRMIGCMYFSKYNTAYKEDLPIDLFRSKAGAVEGICLDQSIHNEWLDEIRTNSKLRGISENCYLPSNEALRLHWFRCVWLFNYWKQAII